MKILAGIPTRQRSTSGPIADVLAQVVDEVVVIGQGATVRHTSPKVHVIEKDPNFGLVNARNAILSYGFENGYDFIFQSDDDLKFGPETIANMMRILVDETNLGILCSASRAYFNWSKDVECNKDFILAPCAPQLWGARTDLLREVGYFALPYLEDREYSVRMWKLGFAVAQMQITLNLAHNNFMSRTNVTTKSGGQPEDSSHTGLKEAIDQMNEEHGDVVKLKYLGARGRSFTSRYNWPALIKCVVDRGNLMGYEDSKGRVL